MDTKSKYSQYDSKKVNSVDTNETHLFAGIISFFFPAWGELFRGHYKNWLLYSFIGLPLVVLISFMFMVSGIGIPIGAIIFLLYEIKCARMSYNDKGLTDGISGFFTKRNILIIILVVVIGIFAIRTIGLMYNDQQKAKVTPIVNNTTHNNTTHVNTTVEKISTDNNDNYQESQDTTTSNSESNSEEMVWSNGGYVEKGKVDIIKQYGMGPESEKAMREAGY